MGKNRKDIDPNYEPAFHHWNGGGSRWVSYMPTRDDLDSQREHMDGMHIERFGGIDENYG